MPIKRKNEQKNTINTNLLDNKINYKGISTIQAR